MNFWERVDELLDEQYKSGKELAIEAKFSASNISKGKKDGNIPAADTAVRIAKVLGVTVEYLVTGRNQSEKNDLAISDKQLVKKYSHEIQFLEKLTPSKRKTFDSFLENLEDWEK